ncbi:MAG: KH domain-containing protein [Candidatus Saccharibacteria bacterium]|nr:KH domain-containing protein [Candidatus Saccharibacteria bacterium]
MSSIDQQFVEYIVKSLVGNPDAVVIERSVDDKGVLLELTVDPEDLGRIIGKRGATAQSLRTLLRALGTKNEARYNLKIVDNGPEDYVRPERPERSDRQNQNDRPAQIAAEDVGASQAPQKTVQDDDSEAPDESDETHTSVNSFAEDLVAEVKEDDNRQSDMARKTRAELEDLDDLDI